MSKGRADSGDDHPNRGPHVECRVDHRGRGVPRHCTHGCPWPCPQAIPHRPPTLSCGRRSAHNNHGYERDGAAHNCPGSAGRQR